MHSSCLRCCDHPQATFPLESTSTVGWRDKQPSGFRRTSNELTNWLVDFIPLTLTREGWLRLRQRCRIAMTNRAVPLTKRRLQTKACRCSFATVRCLSRGSLELYLGDLTFDWQRESDNCQGRRTRSLRYPSAHPECFKERMD